MIKAHHRNGVLQNLSSDGLLYEFKSTIQYHGYELQKVEADYCRVINDNERVFGRWNCCVTGLKLKRAAILEAGGRFKEAEVLLIGLPQDYQTESGRSQLSSSLNCKSSNLRVDKSRWMRFEETVNGPPLLFIEPPADLSLPMDRTKLQEGHAAIDSILDCLNERIPETIELLESLAMSYAGQQHWSEAEMIFLHLTKNRVEHLG